jgi:hypothetical protein
VRGAEGARHHSARQQPWTGFSTVSPFSTTRAAPPNPARVRSAHHGKFSFHLPVALGDALVGQEKDGDASEIADLGKRFFTPLRDLLAEAPRPTYISLERLIRFLLRFKRNADIVIRDQTRSPPIFAAL